MVRWAMVKVCPGRPRITSCSASTPGSRTEWTATPSLSAPRAPSSTTFSVREYANGRSRATPMRRAVATAVPEGASALAAGVVDVLGCHQGRLQGGPDLSPVTSQKHPNHPATLLVARAPARLTKPICETNLALLAVDSYGGGVHANGAEDIRGCDAPVGSADTGRDFRGVTDPEA